MRLITEQCCRNETLILNTDVWMKHATVQCECYIKPLCQILECNEA